jgi:N-acetylmuramic acid 6-phosphate etherase
MALSPAGREAVFAAIEGAEDDPALARPTSLRPRLGRTTSCCSSPRRAGRRTSRGALASRPRAGALTVGIVNNAGAPIAAEADIGITLDTGSEAISAARG